MKHDCVKFGFELKGQFNIGHQWHIVMSGMTVQIIWGMQISEGKIIQAILYSQLTFCTLDVGLECIIKMTHHSHPQI